MLLLWFFDPLGAATNADRMSAALFYRVVAPLYPAPYGKALTHKYTSYRQKSRLEEKNYFQDFSPFADKTQIAVIVINDESLASMRVDRTEPKDFKVEIFQPASKERRSAAAWPPSFAIHKEIVKKIFESATPKALFIDFGFFDERSSQELEQFADILNTYAVPSEAFKPCLGERPRSPESTCTGWERQAPIFLPRADASAPTHLKVLQPLRDAATKLASTKYIGEDFGTYNQYDLFDCADGTPPDVPLALAPSAALAMFSASGEVPAFRAADCDAKKKPERLSVYWSDWGNAKQGRGAYRCRTLPAKFLGRFWRTVLIGIGVEDRVSQFQDCPPHLSVSAHEFLADDTGLMAAVLDDRYVFYGGNFAMADDLIRPPTHNAIPGVYVHAMVLDNLLQHRTKPVDSVWLGFFMTLFAVTLAAICFAMTWASVDYVTSPSAGGAARDGAMFSAVRYQRVNIAQTCLRRRSGGAIVKSRSAVWSVVKVFAVRLVPRRLPLWVLLHERLCFLALQRRKQIRKTLLTIIVVLFGVFVCFVVICVLAAIGFFWLDLAPINYIGIFSFVGLHGLIRGLDSLLEAVF